MAAETLSTYLTKTRRLLHDLSASYAPVDPPSATIAQYFSDQDLTADINAAISERDLWSGGSRSYQAGIALTVGQDAYVLSTLFPNLTVLDVLNVILIWGSNRRVLDNPSFTELTTKYRVLTTAQNVPRGFARYGATSIYIAPPPATAYTADFDLSVLSTTLVKLADQDPLPYPYTKPVPYYAAYLAKINQRRYEEAEIFKGYYISAIRDIEGARVGQMLSAYATTRSGRPTGY